MLSAGILSLSLPFLFAPAVLGDTFTNYFAGDSEGACGQWHQDSEWVVALPYYLWDGGSHCGEQVHITANGMSATATIVDECGQGCASDLDFSQSLFGYFVGGEQNNEQVGVLTGSYTFGSGSSGSSGNSGNSGNDDDTTTTTSTKHTTTTTSTHTTPTTTSTTTTHTTTSSTTTTHSSSTTTTSHSSSAPVSKSSATPSPSPSTTTSATATPTGGTEFGGVQ
ncbi:hypothetical protein MSAN_01239000 [Mycena sanguinolenta]|uniref:Uncharacterized protein n=1 Tax=Mycena sanguinolenta TaxID=230812 RepID=A0A8H6YJC8_9AGAR|nr:hypothetical protein MSAN_01239000 [Mycena sanguinolenta]